MHHISRLEVKALKNYHTHTFRCQHAEGDVADYAQMALEKGLSVLGIADHTSLPDNRWLTMRMASSALPTYVRAIDEAQVRYPDLTILKGMECEWTPEYHNYFKDELLGKYAFDYLILGCHFFPLRGRYASSHGEIVDSKSLAAYTEFLIQSMESGLFTFVAHPDLFGLSYSMWDQNTMAAARDILSAAQELELPLEINGFGIMKRRVETPAGYRTAYPWQPFWELAREYKITVIVNSDAHRPDYVDLGLKEGTAFAESLGLTLANLDYLEGK